MVALGLSYFDLGSRLAAVGFFFATGQRNYAYFQLGILLFNNVAQSLLVALTNQPMWEHLLVWTWTKLAADMYRAVTKKPRSEGGGWNSEELCKYSRLIDLATESMPSAIFQSYVLATSPEWSIFSVITLCSSLASSAYTCADAHLRSDVDRGNRLYSLHFDCLM